jgi:pimeloyl-ACP methyl ester carboxylesterase
LLQKDQCPKASTTLAASQLALPGTPLEQSSETNPAVKSGGGSSLASQKQIDAGVLTVGYAEACPADGAPVILLHGWPCGIHSFVDVAPLFALRGCRVIVLYLRGYGPTYLLSSETARSGQQSVAAVHVFALMDAENSEGDPRRL